MNDLSEKQKRFADFYIESGNATEAYIRAGYSEKLANTNASKLLQNTTIKFYIEQRNKQLESNRIADIEEVKTFWTNTMRNDELDLKDRLKASEYIAKTNAAFIDKINLEGNSLVQIVDNIPRSDKK